MTDGFRFAERGNSMSVSNFSVMQRSIPTPTALAARMQVMPSIPIKTAPKPEGICRSTAKGKSNFLLTPFSGKTPPFSQGRSKSTGSLEVLEVRALGDDAPVKEGDAHLKGPHEAFMQRLKSHAARQKATETKAFLTSYRADPMPLPANEAKLDELLKNTEKRAEELKQRSEDLQFEVTEAERKVEKVNTSGSFRASDSELQSLNAFERSQRRIQEDKREEDMQKQRDEVQANYAKVHRRMQTELIELRDYKVILREYRRVRLEKLQETLRLTTDGNRMRACVREMIRHGAQRILQKMEVADLPLPPWMNEVLVNCCHVEIRIGQEEEKLLKIRRMALKPMKENVEAMLARTKRERFDALCERTWQGRHTASSVDESSKPPGTAGASRSTLAPEDFPSALRRQSRRQSTGSSDQNGAPPGTAEGGVDVWGAPMVTFSELGSGTAPGTAESLQQEQVLQEMRNSEVHILSLRRLLTDMRNNAAAIICNQIRQVEKGGERQMATNAAQWGSNMLSLLVSEEFAKATMKELRKSAPAERLTQ